MNHLILVFMLACGLSVLVLMPGCVRNQRGLEAPPSERCDESTAAAISDQSAASTVAGEFDRRGDINLSAGRYDMASSCYGQALEVRRHWLGTLHLSQVESLYRLATVAEAGEDYKDAVRYYRRAIKLLEQQSLHDPRKIGSFQCYLAAIRYHDSAGDALAGIEHRLAMSRRIYGSGNVFLGALLHRLANIQLAAKRYAESEQAFKQAMGTVVQHCGQNHPYYALLLEDYMELLSATDRPEQMARLKQLADTINGQFPEKQHTALYSRRAAAGSKQP